MVTFLGGCFDSETEIALYNLDDLNQSVIAVHNGHISDKKLGDPLSTFIISKLKDKGKDGPPYYLNHLSVSKNNVPLRSHTFLILDKLGNPRGAITISSDVTQYQMALDVLQRLSYLPTPSTTSEGQQDLEKLYTTPKEMILHIIGDVTGGKAIQTNRLTPAKKTEVVRRLHAENFFLMKGAVVQIASMLESSEATIYRYLSKITKEGETTA